MHNNDYYILAGIAAASVAGMLVYMSLLISGAESLTELLFLT